MKGTTAGGILLAGALLALPALSRPAAAAFEDLGFGARAPGMGDAFTGAADDVSAVYYNPAGLAEVERPKVLAAYSMLYSGLSDGSNLGLSAAAFATPLAAGRAGTLGALWQQFSLSGVYSETTGSLGWGYRFGKDSSLRDLSVGASMKYLSHGFGRLDETYNAVESGVLQNGNTDPVLAGANSRSAFDADLGAQYRLNKRWTLGAAMMNAMQADVAFSSSDKDRVPRKTRLGASYKSLWLLLSGDAHFQKAPDGKLDKQVVVAAEKVFPSLDKGDFGIRGSLGAGDRDFRQVTAGLSYKVQRIQFDYAFVLPLGTVSGTSGSHKLAMTYHFGSATQSELAETELLDQYKRLREAQDYKNAREIASLSDPRLADVKALARKEDYYGANKLLTEKAADLLPDASVVGLTKRLATVASFYPSLAVEGRPRQRWEALLSAGAWDFVNGFDQRAIKELSYAQSLNQQDSSLSSFLERAGELARIAPDRVPSDFAGGWSEYKMSQSDDFYGKKRYQDALRRLEEMLELEPNDLMALKKSGSCSYMLGNYAGAVHYWEKASRLEQDPSEKAKLDKMLSDARAKQGKGAAWVPPGSAAAAEELPAPKAPATDAREIEKIYQSGADYYAKGDYGKAADAFRKILTIDPQNAQAKKALERIIRLSR
jgi:tetratricopeptide (TPR) repeat protein